MELKIGAALRRLRSEKGITQEELAREIGVSFQAVSKWETGTTTPDVALLPVLAAYFGITIDTLFGIDINDHLERVDSMLNHDKLTEENYFYAKRILDGILAENAGDVRALKRLANLYSSAGQRLNREAATSAKQAISLCPQDEELYSTLRLALWGDNYTSFSGSSEFADFSEPFAEHHPGVERLQCMIAEAYISIRQYDQAAEAIARLKRAGSFLAGIYEGDLALGRGDMAQARTAWEKAAHDDTRANYEVGERFVRIGDDEKAIGYFEDAFETCPHPKILCSTYSLAFLYTRQGKYDKAITMWERILNVLASDYGETDGNNTEWPRSEIEKLKCRMKDEN